MARPRGAKARAEEVLTRLAREYPEAECALVHDDAFQLLAADDPVGADHRRERQQGHAGAVREVPDARRPRPRRSADVEQLVFPTGFYRSKTKNLLGMARMLDDEFDGEVPDRARGPREAARRRAQDRQRGAVGRVRPARPARRHPRRPARPPAQAHDRDRSGQGRARPQRARPAGGAGPLLAAPHPARPPGVLRPQAELRRLRARRHLPVGGRPTASLDR